MIAVVSLGWVARTTWPAVGFLLDPVQKCVNFLGTNALLGPHDIARKFAFYARNSEAVRIKEDHMVSYLIATFF